MLINKRREHILIDKTLVLSKNIIKTDKLGIQIGITAHSLQGIKRIFEAKEISAAHYSKKIFFCRFRW